MLAHEGHLVFGVGQRVLSEVITHRERIGTECVFIRAVNEFRLGDALRGPA